MRIQSLLVVSVTALVWCAAAIAQNQRLDIILEGPWIYYQDNQFIGADGTQKPVLMAMAPKTGHHNPTFTTGHGSTFPNPGVVYCVGYNNNCATGTGTLAAVNYPGLMTIPVKTKPGWKWYASIASDYWYVILPMPNSASNDGVDYMFLEQTFHTPVVANTNDTEFSIGLQLHYDSWPSQTVSLISCTDPGIASTADKCDHPQSHYDQPQNGTLRIAMTGLAETGTAEKCNYHLRAAYHHRILFLDDTPLDSGKNVNRDKEYIDLRAENTDQYEASCYLCDPQYKPDASCPRMPMTQDYTHTDAKELLKNIVHDLAQLDSKRQDALQVAALGEIRTELTDRRFPNPDQLVKIRRLLELSIRAVQDVYELDAKAKLTARAGADAKPPLAVKVAGEEQELLDYTILSPTSGKDCKAAQMLITSN